MLYIAIRLLFNALSLVLAATLLSGITFDSPGSIFIAAIAIAVVNAFVRPVLVVLTLPITVVTMGVFLIVLNALMVQFSAWMVRGFHVESFWSALVASLILSLVSFVGARFISSRTPR